MALLFRDNFAEAHPMGVEMVFADEIQENNGMDDSQARMSFPARYEHESPLFAHEVEQEFAIAFYVGVAVVEDEIATRRIITVALESEDFAAV